MRKSIVLFISALMLSISIKAQLSEESLEDFVGTTLTVKDVSESVRGYGYSNFYSDPKVREPFGNPSEKSQFNTNYNDLFGKSFKVIGVSKHSIYKFLELSNPELGTVYFKYRKNDWCFDVSGLPSDFYCKQLVRTVDKFDTSKNESRTPYNDLTAIKKDVGTFYLSLTTSTTSIGDHANGVFLLFEDGSKLQFPNVETEPQTPIGDGNWRYTAFFSIDKEQQQELASKRITDIRLYVYDNEISDNEGVEFMNYMKCLTE